MKINDTTLELLHGDFVIAEVNKRGQSKAGGKIVNDEFKEALVKRFSGYTSLIYSKEGKPFMVNVKEITEEEAEQFRLKCHAERKRKSSILSAILSSSNIYGRF